MKAICICENCNNEGTVKTTLARRGGRNAYLCAYHARHLESYFAENHTWIGKVKVCKITVSIENETAATTIKGRAEMIANKYLPSQDGTVDVEYKSPCMIGLNALSKQCATIESLINSGDMVIDDTCGTHCHIGEANFINAETMGYIKRFYHSLFIPLCEEMQANADKTAALFGRYFGGWAREIYSGIDPTDHRNFINTEHDETLEYRICKFNNAKQYMQAVKCCKDFTLCVIENFIKHFDDEDFDKTRYATITDYRKHKASVTAGKLVKIFHKYADNED